MARFGVSVKVEGLEKANERLQAIAKQLPKEADRLVQDKAEKIFSLSQELVPVDTGILQRSGVHKHEFLISEVAYNTPYAKFVHDGTSRMEARPFLGQAVSAVLPEIQKEIKEIAKL